MPVLVRVQGQFVIVKVVGLVTVYVTFPTANFVGSYLA